MRRRIFNLVVALDQVIYVIVTLGAGSPDETLSAAAWRTEQDGKLMGRFFRPIIDAVFRSLFREENHCQNSYHSEVMRKHLPEHYERQD